MPDSKITALTSISTSTDPANDPLVIVDVSDTSMAATGTTKKVTLNQLLGASGTATLASATITGDLTVDASTLKVDSALNNVGIGTASPNNNTNRTSLTINNGTWGGQLDINVGATNHASFGTDNFDSGASCRLQSKDGIVLKTAGTGASSYLQLISSTGVTTWYDGAGGTRMTLNATGLGVGGSPVSNYKLLSAKTSGGAQLALTTGGLNGSNASPLNIDLDFLGFSNETRARIRSTDQTSDTGNGFLSFWTQNSGTFTEKMRLSTEGNVGIGVAPSYKLDVRGSDNSVIAQFGGTNRQVRLSTSAISAVDNASFNFIHTSGSGRFTFQNNSGTQTMLTIDDNGNNILRMPVTPPTLGVNLEGTFNLTSNTNLRISVRGSDGVTRVANITLA